MATMQEYKPLPYIGKVFCGSDVNILESPAFSGKTTLNNALAFDHTIAELKKENVIVVMSGCDDGAARYCCMGDQFKVASLNAILGKSEKDCKKYGNFYEIRSRRNNKNIRVVFSGCKGNNYKNLEYIGEIDVWIAPIADGLKPEFIEFMLRILPKSSKIYMDCEPGRLDDILSRIDFGSRSVNHEMYDYKLF